MQPLPLLLSRIVLLPLASQSQGLLLLNRMEPLLVQLPCAVELQAPGPVRDLLELGVEEPPLSLQFRRDTAPHMPFLLSLWPGSSPYLLSIPRCRPWRFLLEPKFGQAPL